ncbi:MAG: 3-dehydroquinate synthase [Actinomycetota bacterium]
MGAVQVVRLALRGRALPAAALARVAHDVPLSHHDQATARLAFWITPRDRWPSILFCAARPGGDKGSFGGLAHMESNLRLQSSDTATLIPAMQPAEAFDSIPPDESVSPPASRLAWNESPAAFHIRVVRDERYEILIEKGIARDIGRAMLPVMRSIDSKSVLVIIDGRLGKALGAEVVDSLRSLGLPSKVIVVHPGERSKSRGTATRLLDELRHAGAERRTTLLAIGGGVLCDLVGLVASLYMRGLPYVNVPTTLMAQVDGAIGGKVAVNHPEAKNLIGAFYHPVQVLIDVDLMRSLPRREISNGLAEVVKVAVIADARLFALVEGLDLADADPLGEIVRRSIAAKLALLADDPFERDLRRVLNFGHSIGHALESATGYRIYRHGEAVSVGIAAATEVSAQAGICTEDTRNRIIGTLRRLALPTSVPRDLFASVWAHIEMIKRIRNGALNFVLPADIGAVVIRDDLSWASYLSALENLAGRSSASRPDV